MCVCCCLCIYPCESSQLSPRLQVKRYQGQIQGQQWKIYDCTQIWPFTLGWPVDLQCSAQQNMYVYPHRLSSTLWQRQSNCSWWGSLRLLMFLFTAIFYTTATSQPAALPRLFKLPSSYLMSVDLILLSRNIGCVSHSLALRSSLWSFTFTSASSAHDLSI